jgi:hypothetical protein
MKNEKQFQEQLFSALRKEPGLRVSSPPWSEEALSEVVWIVKSFLASPNSSVRNEDLLNDLVDRYEFRGSSR